MGCRADPTRRLRPPRFRSGRPQKSRPLACLMVPNATRNAYFSKSLACLSSFLINFTCWDPLGLSWSSGAHVWHLLGFPWAPLSASWAPLGAASRQFRYNVYVRNPLGRSWSSAIQSFLVLPELFFGASWPSGWPSSQNLCPASRRCCCGFLWW